MRFLLSALFAATAALPLVRADAPLDLHVGGQWRKMTRAECALKAVASLGVREKFIHAEVMPDGNVFGRDESSAVLVASVPHGDGVAIAIFACSRIEGEAERLRNRVRAHVLDGPLDPKTPKRITTKDADRKPTDLVIRWIGEARYGTFTDEATTAAVVLRNHRLRARAEGGVLFGVCRDIFAAITFIPGAKPSDGVFGIVTTCDQPEQADQLGESIRACLCPAGQGQHPDAEKGTDLLVNGDFEEGPDPGHRTELAQGSAGLKGWQVIRSGVEYVGTDWKPADGIRSVALCGADHMGGGVRQTFATQKGKKYRVRLCVAGVPGRGEEKVTVRAADQEATFTVDGTYACRALMGWVGKTWEFTAVGEKTTLEIFNPRSKLNARAHGPALDRVSVVAIEEDKPTPLPGPQGGSGIDRPVLTRLPALHLTAHAAD